MAALQCAKPQTASTIDILGETANATDVSCSRRAFSPKRRRHRFTKFEVSLVVVAMLLLVALVVTTLVLMLSKSHDESTHDKGIRNPSEAILSLARILNNMDNTVDPCENFYQYACGGWLKKTHIDDSDGAVFTFKQVQKENRRTFKEILENEKFRSNYSRNPSILKVFDLYSSCMNTTAIESFGDSELRALYSELRVFNITKAPENGGGFRWDEVVIKVKRKLGLDMFFKLEINDDLRNSSIKRIVMRAVQLGLNQETYTASNSSQQMPIRQYYLEYMTDLMELATRKNRSSVRKEMDLVLDLESKISKTQLTPIQRQNLSLIYNLETIQMLTDKTSKVDWLIFFRTLTSGAGYVLQEDEKLLITSPKMIQEIVILLNSTDSGVISNYIAWTIVRNLIDVLPKKYGVAYRKYQRIVFNTNDLQGEPKWLKCIEATSNIFPVATATLFAAHALPKDRVNESKKILNYVQEALLKVIPRQLWLDKKSQSGALEKAKAMIFDVAYPDNMTSAQTYPNLTVSMKSYFTINVKVSSFLFMKSFKSLKTTVDRTEFLNSDPLTPVAYYYFTRNKVALPVGFLCNSFYHGNSYGFLNFGALGMVVGHEITHGFDLRGSSFDKTGHRQKWLSDGSTKNLSEKTSCFSKQNSQLKYKGQNINGNIGLRESFSDAGGLKLAFEAYKLWTRHNSEEPIVAGLKLTNHQLFFLSYAQMWCAKYKESEVLRMLNTGRYLPMTFRVRGSVMNSQNFADAFSCPVGSATNPEKKCEVW